MRTSAMSMLILTLAAIDTGCAYQSGTAALSVPESPLFYKAHHIQLDKGVTTKNDVIAYLGYPIRQSADQQVLIYLWNERPEWTGIKSPTEDAGEHADSMPYTMYLLMEFDNNNLLREYTYKDSRAAKNPL